MALWTSVLPESVLPESVPPVDALPVEVSPIADTPTDVASPGGIAPAVVIDCDECRFQGTEVCADCVVTFLCGRSADDAVVIDVAEARAVRLLSAAGLVPALRHRRAG